MKTNLLNKLSNGRKKGLSKSQVGTKSSELPGLLFNQSFGTVGGSNQTGETLTRENRIGLMSYLRRTLMLLFAILVMSIANIGTAWGAVYKTYSLSDLTNTSLTYEKTGLSGNDQKLNKGERKVEVPCASASGTLYLSGTGANADRYASIWGSNGTAVDASRKIAMTSGYGSGISFTSADILTEGGKYYIIFSNVDGSDYKINAFKYVLSSACGGGASGKNIYLKPNGIWNPGSGERFAAYYWKSANTSDNGWMDFASYNSCTPVYKAVIPAGYDKTILCRMDGSKAANNWDNKWNQTLDLTVPTGNDTLYTISSINGCTDGKSCGSWGTYTAPTYTISFNGNGSTSGSTSSHTGIACNGSQTLRANGFTRTGWTFTGWNTSPYGDGTAYAAGATINSITSDITLYAQWEKVMYMKSSMSWWYDASAWFAVWVANADESKQAWVAMTKAENCSDPEVYKATVPGNGYTKVVFVRKNPANMTLATWDNKWNQSSKESMPTSNNQFTITGGSDDNCTGSWGTYSAPTLTISYNNGGGSGSMSSQTSIACGTDKATTANAFTRDGYSFTGWKADVDVKVGGSTKTAGTLLADGVTIQDISSNITLTAQWEEVVTLYTVTYNVNGGGSVTPTSATQASSGASVTLPTPTWSGYTFDGWYNAGTKIGNGGASYTPTADITLYAHWTDNISGKVFSFIDNNYGDKFKSFTGYGWVAKDSTGRSKTFTNASTGVEYRVSAAGWDKKNNAISALAKFLGGTSSMSIVIPTGKIATVKISYNAYGTGDDYRLTVNSTAQANPSTKLADGNTNAQVISNMKEITLSSQTGTLTLGISNTSKNNYIGRVSAVITGYTVSYAAGTYGSGSLASGTKTAGSSFTLSSSSSAFTRDGYVYDGWSINADGSTKDYNLGGSYTTDAAITLYPHWVSDCVAPTTVNVTATVNEVSGFWFYPDDDVVLTAAPTGSPAGSPVTYQWKKNGADIDGATSSTYTINDAAASEAGKYTCTISYGACSTTSAEFELKCMQFYLKNSSGEDISNHALTKVDATHATLDLSLTGGTTYNFRITDGCGNWYGNSDATGMTSSNCTNWTMPHDADAKMTTSVKSATYTFNFDFSSGLLGSEMKVSIVYPEGDQAAGKVIYWDNSVLEWGEAWYRIGKGTHNTKTKMTLVPGTANLYKVTTAEYNGFEYWHIANNEGEGTTNLYWTKDSDPTTNEEITNAMGFEGSPVTAAAVTFTPTSSHATGSSSDNDNCEFYEYGQQNGMKRDRVTITAPTNGTITVNYTSEEDVASSFSATTVDVNQDLAHTVIITPTATPATGYNLGSLTVNEVAHTSGNTYTVTANTTIAATFTAKTYNITLDINGASSGSESVTMTYNSSSHTAITAPVKAGYTFDGWYDSETDNNGSGNLVMNASGVLQENVTGFTGAGGIWTKDATCTLYAKWTEEVAPTDVCWDPATTPADKLANNTTTLTTLTSRFAAIDGVTSVTVDNPGTGTGQCAGSDDGNGYLKVKNASENKIITIVTTAATNITIGGQQYSSNTGSFYLVKSTATSTKLAECNTDGEDDEATNLPAGTYYIYAKASTKSINFSKLCIELYECSTPAAPTVFSAGSITSTAATFSITDAADAASYDIYYSTSSDAPTASTPATTTSTSKTKAVTGLTASTTYYAWVRSVCDADHKSAWVAGSSFETSAAPAGTTYYLVTSTDQLNTTDTYVIMDDGKGAMMGVASGSNPYLNAITSGFTVAADKSTVTVTSSDVNTLTLKSESDAWNLFGKDSHYITTNSTVSGNLYGNATSGSSTDDFVFSFADGKVTIKRNTTTDYHIYYSSGTGFNQSTSSTNIRLYTSNSTPVYTVTYDLNGGTGTVPTNRPEKSGTSITLASSTGLTKDGFTFDGWLCSVNSTKYAAGASYTMTAANTTFTAQWVAAESYSITYHCNGAESGCPSNVAAAYTLPSPLPTGLSKDGYDFGGWFTDSECTVAAVAGAALTANTDLYAKWTVHSASECITIAYFETTAHNNSSSKPDNAGKYIYGYTNSAKTEAYAYTITSSTGDNKGQGTGESDYLRMNYGTTVTIYADNTTTGGTPASFSNVTSVSVDFKMKNSTYYTSFDIYVGSTKIANNVSLEGAAQSAFTTFTYDNLEQLSGTVRIVNKGSGSSNYHFYVDNIVICTASMSSCTTPTLPTATLNDQALCEGADIATWTATPINASTITGKGESISYSWKKKGSETVLGTGATFDLGASAAESQAGTYVVTVTVSKAGYASASASKEVDLTVTESTEVTSITADKATVYEGNSVTLTATANTTVTWQWYTCTNAEGAGESSISGAESASYTIASAGAAGTYYYKAKATGSCGTAERVYTLTVTAASGGDCETYYFFANAADATTNGVTQNEESFFSGASEGTNNNSTSITVDGNNLSITKRTSASAYSVVFTIPTGATATLCTNAKANNTSYPLTITRSSDSEVMEITNSTTLANYTLADIPEGTWTLSSGSGKNWYYGAIIVKVCSGEVCTDPEVTASADNTTACVGTSVTFTATGTHASATYQWQKLDGTWTNISGATESTYNIPSVVAGDAGKYRVIASHVCNRTSNEVTLSVPSAPNFGSTVPASVSIMQTLALSISTVEATDAVKYRWYKSADATWDAGDTEIGTNKELIKAYDSEAIGSPSYYIFCRAQNACGITTSSAIAVNVTAYVEEDCATRGNEGDAAFSFENSGCGQGTYNSASCWTMNSNSKKLIYAAPEGKYFKTMKVTIASSSASKASYNWSTNGGTTFTEVAISSINTTLTEKTFNLSAHGNVNALQIGRNLNGQGESSGTLYVSKICFEYTDACSATTVTPSTASTSYEMGGAWSNPTFTLTPAAVSGETLTYSSSNEDIASVDDDGTVTFNGEAGTVTITASYAGGTISATDYCASSGSYTITVSCTGGAPKVVASGTTVGCSSSITLQAKKQDGTAFADGTYQWFRNGEEIDGETGSSYTATQAGTYTVERTNGTGCTTPSTNSAIVTSETTEPEVERLVPFQYYHVDKDYSDQMKMRHLFAVKNSGKLDGKSFKMYVSRNGGAATDVTSSNALVVVPNGDGHVDTVMVDLNKLSGKYSEDDELVFTCKAIDCSGNVSDVYKETITMNVIDETPTLALICSGSSKAGGTRKTGELTVGGDFLTGYNVADLCQQTGNTSFDANTEWGLYTDLKTQYIVTPVNGYAVFNKLNYEPFDILLLTDYPKASKSDAARDVLDDMAALCDYRPMLSFKTHMVAKSPSKWAEKGFTTSATENKADGRLNLNIVCYAHPMFEGLKSGEDVYNDVGNTSAPLVYTMLSGTGFESGKGMQGFELAAAENFVTIGLTHYNANIAKNSPLAGEVEWTPGSEDRMLVTVAERQANPEARFILFSLNCGAQSKLTEKGEEVILACLNYLLGTAEGTIEPADCSFTFDNGEGNMRTPEEQAINCPTCPPAGDHKWNNPANWGPDYRLLPGEFNSVRIKKPVEVNDEHAHVMEVRIIEEGSIDIPAGKALDVKSTIRRMDGSEIYPTEENDIHIGSASTGNGTLIFNNDEGDTKARVDMYSNAKADMETMSAATSTWQYIGTPHSDVASAIHNYYDSWLYQYSGSGWEVIPNGGPLVPFRGYCVTHPDAPVVFSMEGTLVATTAQDIAIPAGYTVIANSWVAPIDINAITDDDMEGISDKSIYFFNTGSDADGTAVEGTEAGTYRTTPIHSASYTGDWQIPSMQGFYISTTSAGTLHLDYERHVRPTGSRSVVSNQMYAPRRAAAKSNEPNVLKIFARGSRYQDKLVVLEREDFTRGYDSGWDGEAWGGGTLSPMVYVTGDGREDAVSAIPEFEGTVVAFKAGEDSEYRFEFIYDGDESLYLFDTENNTYTQVMTGNAYYFTTTDKAAHSRFILTRKNPQITTGVEEPTSDSSLKGRARKLLIEDKMFIMVNGMLYDATGKVVYK